jgi:membrane protein DedA with SNARE-associated domain
VDVINELILQAAASPWLYLVMFATAAVDGFFPPVPSETVLVAAAAVAATSDDTNLVLLCVAAALGAVLGDNIAYAIGRSLGVRRWSWMRRPRVAAAVDRAQSALERRGALLVLGARYIPVGRVAVNMSAGALRYRWRRFLPLSVVAAVTWAVYSAAIGLVAGAWIEDQPLLGALLGIVLALLIGLALERVAALRRGRRTVVPASQEEGEAIGRRPLEVAG